MKYSLKSLFLWATVCCVAGAAIRIDLFAIPWTGVLCGVICGMLANNVRQVPHGWIPIVGGAIGGFLGVIVYVQLRPPLGLTYLAWEFAVLGAIGGWLAQKGHMMAAWFK